MQQWLKGILMSYFTSLEEVLSHTVLTCASLPVLKPAQIVMLSGLLDVPGKHDHNAIFE
jgi:hypothetical protein